MTTPPNTSLQPVLTSRQAQAPTAAPVLSADAAALDVAIRHAKAIATAGEALPRAYRDRPGAVLLAQEWARARGVDILTAVQTVSFVDGRPVIDATMQRALAQRAGYRVRVEPGSEEATAIVERDGEEVGRATYALDDARVAGLLGKKNWQQNPKAMLVARATTQALRWHAPDVMVGVFSEDDIETDPVAILEPTTAPEPALDDGDVVEAEVVPDDPPAAPQTPAEDTDGPAPLWVTREELVDALKAAGVTQSAAISEARKMAGALGMDQPASVAEIVDAPAQLHHELHAWITKEDDL